ncbi:NACHT, LRR and PYD domains-containing protein 4F-like isoform X2 [Rattus norvegicus]|uniref:NACHT, LRR and PYD domains-containing protein 4F-like isoform X2 n=1 Tax=Rattus norvegicus TaxID=10116 RepID=UPI0019178870|nr:NACHT, LRR and PYD domains-containing protein 4F-like isoform X2 [Rattus norvegicus]
MASFSSDFSLVWYLKELNQKEFMKFKDFLIQEILELKLKQISWTEVKKASREGLSNLLLKCYGENQALDMTFKILQKINRKDLTKKATREIAENSKLYREHLKKKLSHNCSKMFNINIQDFILETVIQDDYDTFENLLVSKGDEKKPHMVFLKGMAGIGKTLMLKNVMLAWAKGLVFQNKFSYTFYFCCQDVKQLKTASLAELISREWPISSAPIEEILSQPEKLLFIIDSLEGMEWDLTKQESELCGNCTEKQPVSLLLSSLLRRKMLPESSFLISATPETFEKMEDRIRCTDVKTATAFNERSIEICFHRLFQDRNTAQKAFSLVRENEQLFTLCQAPLLCWMVATCLKKEIEKGKDPVSICRHITSLYTTYIFNSFIPQSAKYPSKKSQDQLQGLCSLAAEGMWTDTFVFSEEALRRNGIMDSDIPTLLDIGMLGKIREFENSYLFLHPSVQEICAAIFYLLKSHGVHPSQDVKSVETVLFMFLKKVKTQWILWGSFIFGLLHKSEQEKLAVFFGYQLSQKIRHKLYQCLETINGNVELQEQIDGMKLFYCLFEMEDDAFLVKAVNCMQQINFVANYYSDFFVAAYCLKRCSTLKKLSFSTQNALNEELEQQERLLICWNDICSVFVRSKNIQTLQIKDTNFSEPTFRVLYESLKYPSFPLSKLVANNVHFFGDNHMFFELIQNHNLQYLDLSCSSLSPNGVKLLFDVLNQAECNIEKLILANCSLSEQCWDYLSDVLRKNKTLNHLDISCNDLKDKGIKILCKALTLPDCFMKSLCLKHCQITTRGCQDLAEVLRNNQNLKHLHVSNNKLKDAGVKLLCDAIKHPNCHLVDLGL